MTFVHSADLGSTAHGFTVQVGPDQGVRRLLLAIGRIPAEEEGHVHHHDGDELIRVIAGELRFRIGEKQQTCRPGDIAVVPPGVAHGFLVRDEAVIEVFAEQAMGSFYRVRHRSGGDEVIEVHRPGVPWDREPPPGAGATTTAQMADIARRIATRVTNR